MSLQPKVFPPFPSPQVEAVQEYLKCLSKFDLEGLSRLIMDNFTLTVSPMNLGVPDKTKDEEFAFLKELQARLNGKPLIITVYDVNDGETKTWVYAKLEPLNLEIVYFFQFDKGHSAHKIVSVKEFVDSKSYLDKPEESSEPST